MSENERAGSSALPAGMLLGGMALAGAAVGGTALLRRFDAWALQMITHPERRDVGATPADLGLDYEEVWLRSDDEVDLYGWLIPAPGGAPHARATLILGHGYSDTIDSILGPVAYLQPAGYNVLMLNFRAHGRSSGDTSSIGYLEHQDIAAGLRYLEDRHLRRIGIMGWSLGGAVAIVSAALYPQIAGVIADSTFARLGSPLGQMAAQVLHHPTWLARAEGWYGERLVARSLGYNVTDARPETLIGRISPRPILIIHSGEDKLIPVANARRLYARAGEPKDLWITPAGDHAWGPAQEFPEEYRARVLDFWDRVFPAEGGR